MVQTNGQFDKEHTMFDEGGTIHTDNIQNVMFYCVSVLRRICQC